MTENLAHELRERPEKNVTAHLFVYVPPSPFRLTRNKLKLFIYKLFSPGWTWTKLAGDNGTNPKPQGAWTAEETVLYMLDKVRGGEFYVLVPDNETKRELDQLRIMWAAGDVAEGRPPLSRWDKDHKPLYDEYVKEGMAALDN